MEGWLRECSRMTQKSKAGKPLVLLDFDGVICDSLDECFVVGHNAYKRLLRGSQSINRPVEADPQLYRFFRAYRWMVRPAGEYLLLFHYWYSGVHSPNYGTFRADSERLSKEVTQYGQLFFSERRRLRNRDPELWLTLNPLYPDMATAFRALEKKCRIHIVTTKDEESVETILAGRGLAGFEVSGRKEYEMMGSKVGVIKKILNTYRADPSEAFFLDDNGTYLAEVATLGVRCLRAAWGYQAATACSDSPGIHVCADMEEFCNMVFSMLEHEEVRRANNS